MYESFSKNESVLDKSKEDKPGNGARKMLTKVVNSLSAKMEIGAPMAALYLLKNPDHYTSHQFIPFYWKNYHTYVEGQWNALLDIADPGEGVSVKLEDGDHGNHGHPEVDLAPLEDAPGHSETVQMARMDGYLLAKTNTDDYRFRPLQMENICLYDFIQCSLKHPIRSQRLPKRDLRWLNLHEHHPQHTTHVVALDPSRRLLYVPHFIGPALPRRDAGNREDYCCTMLTLFCPWRTGIDLRSAETTWEETFRKYAFTDQQRTLMENFNMRYECYDARDDYGAITKSAGGSEGDAGDSEDEDIYPDNGENPEDDDELLEMGFGKAAANLQRSNAALTQALRAAGWKAKSQDRKADARALKLPTIAIDSALRSGAWNNIIKVEKLRAWRRKMSGFLRVGESETHEQNGGNLREVRNDAYVVPGSYISKDFQPPQEKWSDIMTRVVADFKLNDGQEKAFRIVANHSCCIAPEQLLMHLGGMGGTGKSTVIRALCQFFNDRNETYRFVLLGPTGTSAALIGGSTYHTFLGINQGASATGSTSAKVEEVRE
ncbi:hypothetical protein DFP72DRAFT_745796, partial [Ephemerocybe angulata]